MSQVEKEIIFNIYLLFLLFMNVKRFKRTFFAVSFCTQLYKK